MGVKKSKPKPRTESAPLLREKYPREYAREIIALVGHPDAVERVAAIKAGVPKRLLPLVNSHLQDWKAKRGLL